MELKNLSLVTFYLPTYRNQCTFDRLGFYAEIQIIFASVRQSRCFSQQNQRPLFISVLFVNAQKIS